MEINEKFLPLGTLVLLKNAKEKIMIIGYLTSNGNKTDIVYDYQGCVFPYGLYTNEVSFVFNHSDIDKIYYMGYSDNDFKALNTKLIDFEKKYISDDRKLSKSIADITFLERKVNDGK